MEVYYYLDSNKKGKNPEKMIYCYIRHKREKPLIFSTHEKINPKHWNKNKKRAITTGKGKLDGAKTLNMFLDAFENRIKTAIREIRTDNVGIDFEEIKRKLIEKVANKNPYNLFEVLDIFIRVRENDLKAGTLTKFENLKRLLFEFQSINYLKLSFGAIDLSFYDHFLNFLIYQKNLNNNSAYKNISLLKTFLAWSYDREFNRYDYFRKFKKKEYPVDIVTLSENELKQLEDINLSDNTRLDKTRDLFLFGCYTGARFSDVYNINRADIKENVWYIRQVKTGNTTEVPLIESAVNIIKKYENFEKPLPTISNQKFNQYLKELCQLAGLTEKVRITEQRGNQTTETEYQKFELVSTHTARRTFITLSLTKGMNAQIIMSITGHKSYNSFRKYVNLVTTDKQKALKESWEKPKLRLVEIKKA
ncbi:MAG TPA: tyrosine-type recombinase/integrase [Ignavibacteriaceae bacterium]|nr:tyrosine-type recombinase/integrase [Ignavibacteriaceae bacterium]